MKNNVFLSPSILSADFSSLRNEVIKIEQCGCKYVHLDVMDGRFVPNITFGAPIIKSFRDCSKIIFDTHLMIDNPEKYIDDFSECGSDYITVHIEATNHINSCIKMIHDRGKKAGVALNPGTSITLLDEILPFVDLVLVMSVNPGFGGQKFIETSVDKIRRLNEIKKKNNFNFLINVDGGVNEKNAKTLIDAGCNLLVSGSSFFNANDKTIFRESIENS